MSADVAKEGDKLALTISYRRSVGDGEAAFSTTVPQDIALDDLDKLVDTLQHAGRRFSLHAALEKVNNELEHTDSVENQSILMVDQINKQWEGRPKMRTEDENRLKQAQQNIVLAGAERTKHSGKLLTLKEELGDYYGA